MQVIRFAVTDQEIADCFDCLLELRPHLVRDSFVPLVRHLNGLSGFQLAFLRDGKVRSVAGLRIGEWLCAGRYLEIEDLVSAPDERSRGYGGALFDWLVAYAKRESCRELRLLSGVQRFAAHRFYMRKRMSITAHYFSMTLEP